MHFPWKNVEEFVYDLLTNCSSVQQQRFETMMNNGHKPHIKDLVASSKGQLSLENSVFPNQDLSNHSRCQDSHEEATKIRCSCNCLNAVSSKYRRNRLSLKSRRTSLVMGGMKWIVGPLLLSMLIIVSILLHRRNVTLANLKFEEGETSIISYSASLKKQELRQTLTTTATTNVSSSVEVNSNGRVGRKRKPSLGNPFNPETFDNSSVGRKKYVVIYWSKIRGFKARIQTKHEYEQSAHVWPYTYAGDNCPVQCELTNNRSRASEASAFVVHSRLTDVWDLPPLEYLAPWILQNNENPVYTPALSDPKVMNKFNLLISYRLDSDFPSPIYPKPSLDPPIPFKRRLGNVLAVFSKCEPVRTEYMRQLMKYIDVHSYGACLKNKKGLIGLYSQINGKYVFKDYKFVMSRYYKFSLVFMNQDCDHFVDDRLYHALETGSIPIYMGTNLIDQFLPGNLKNSIIKASDFSGPEKLAEYLKFLSNNETAFNKYLDWKWQGLGDYKNTTIGRWWDQKYPLFCQVCMRLSQGKLHPGLNVDKCKARGYEEWGLEPPYPKTFTKRRPEPEISDQFFMYWKPVALVGIVFGLIIVLMNCCVWCTLSEGKTIKVPL